MPPVQYEIVLVQYKHIGLEEAQEFADEINEVFQPGIEAIVREVKS